MIAKNIISIIISCSVILGEEQETYQTYPLQFPDVVIYDEEKENDQGNPPHYQAPVVLGEEQETAQGYPSQFPDAVIFGGEPEADQSYPPQYPAPVVLGEEQETAQGYPPQYPAPEEHGLSNEECVKKIYRDCNHDTNFTDQELETVRQYLNYTFTKLADIKPDKPLCDKILVRQDWKCLTKTQKDRLVDVWRKLYHQGFFHYISDLHVRYWPAWHKCPEFVSIHRWLYNQLETRMRAIDPDVTIPYSYPWLFGTQPERASIWNYLGTAGNYSNGYCVRNGFYPAALRPCVKRQWSLRGTIYPMGTPEFITYLIQNSPNFAALSTNILGIHFQAHLLYGGYPGQLAVPLAPFDVLFFCTHVAVELEVIRWQFLDPSNLTPLSYNVLGNKYNPINGNVEKADIMTDTLTGVPHERVINAFWLGFGDYCSLPDQIIRLLLNRANGVSDPIPTAVKRMPFEIKEKYFPLFLNLQNFTGFSHILEEVGDCNTRCLPIVKPTFTLETEIGRRQFEAYAYDNGQDLSYNFYYGEQGYYKLWLDLNKAKYCSPYVTTY